MADTLLSFSEPQFLSVGAQKELVLSTLLVLFMFPQSVQQLTEVLLSSLYR